MWRDSRKYIKSFWFFNCFLASSFNKGICIYFQVTPSKVLRTAFGIRALSSVYIQRVFIRTEMLLKSQNGLEGTRQFTRSRSSDNLPNSQSQNNITVASHTLTIREVRFLFKNFLSDMKFYPNLSKIDSHSVI